MLVTRFNPHREFNDLRNVFNQLNALLSDNPDASVTKGVTGFSPSVNTREGEFAYHVEVDLPGVKKEDININVQDNAVTLSGERSVRHEKEENHYYKIESEFGRFERSFSLPENADAENIHAETQDGVLEVIIPKLAAKPDQPRKIEIK